MANVVSGVAGSVRVQQLTRAAITRAMKHAKREDATGKARMVRNRPPLTTTGLELDQLYDAHVADAFVPGGKSKAMHLIIQFPKDLVDPDDAAGMLSHARRFCEQVFGHQAIFADRIDLDERNTQVVDVFVAPKYLKKTKRAEKLAVASTYHLKLLAMKHGEPPIPHGMGRALQTEFFEYLRDTMKLDGVQRGAEKVYAGSDWKSAEEQRLEELEGKRAEFDRLTKQARAVLDKVRKSEAEVEQAQSKVAEDRRAIAADQRKNQERAADLHAGQADLVRGQEQLERDKDLFEFNSERTMRMAKAMKSAQEQKSERLSDRAAELAAAKAELAAQREDFGYERDSLIADCVEVDLQRARLTKERAELEKQAEIVAERERKAGQAALEAAAQAEAAMRMAQAAAAREEKLNRRERAIKAFELGMDALCQGTIAYYPAGAEEKKLSFKGIDKAARSEFGQQILPAWDHLWDLARRNAERIKTEVAAKVKKELALWAGVKEAYEKATEQARGLAGKLREALMTVEPHVRAAVTAEIDVEAAIASADDLASKPEVEPEGLTLVERE